MKYKYTRKEIAKELEGYGRIERCIKLLLAKQEDKKECGKIKRSRKGVQNISGTPFLLIDENICELPCDYGWNITIGGEDIKDLNRSKEFLNKISTPSPLDLIEDLVEIKTLDVSYYLSDLTIKQTLNSLIKNQTKIINYLKGKK